MTTREPIRVSAGPGQLLEELIPLARGSDNLDALAVAIAVEDSFLITLDDGDITPEALCSPMALAATVERYLGGR